MTALLLLASLLGYHALRALRARPPRSVETPLWTPGEEAPKVSFLVPAWNAAKDLPGFVTAYRALAYPHKELVLCVGGPDGGLALAETYAGDGVIVLEQRPGEGKQGALAKSFAASTGGIIYLTDIDCRLGTAGVLRLLEPIVRGGETVVTGSSVPMEAQRAVGAVLVHWAVERAVAGRTPRCSDGLLGRNAAATREAVEAVESFRYSAPTGTDYRMAQLLQRRGHRIWFEPRSEVETEFAWPFGVYVRKQARWLRNVILYAERPRQATELRGALVTVAVPYGVLALFMFALLLGSPLPALIALLLLLHGVLSRLGYVRDLADARLTPRQLLAAALPGSVLNLLATLAAGLYTSLTLLSPALRRQW